MAPCVFDYEAEENTVADSAHSLIPSLPRAVFLPRIIVIIAAPGGNVWQPEPSHRATGSGAAVLARNGAGRHGAGTASKGAKAAGTDVCAG